MPEITDERLAELESIEFNAAKTETQLTNLISDPDVRKILVMKDEGKKVTISDSAPAAKPSPAASPAASAEESLMEKVLSRLNEQLKPLQDVVTFLAGDKKKQFDNQELEALTQTRKTYSDFDKFKSDVDEIRKGNTGLSPSEAYIIAKARKGEPVDTSSPASERPSNSLGRPVSQIGTVENVDKKGTSGFRELLSKTREFDPSIISSNATAEE